MTNEASTLNCQCDLCRAFRADKDITSDSNSDRMFIQSDSEYTSDSVVSKHKERIKELVDAHWGYIERLLTTGQNTSQTFTWEQMKAIREFDYKSVARHFYGHGYEDAERGLE